jgi:hypothetical protein
MTFGLGLIPASLHPDLCDPWVAAKRPQSLGRNLAPGLADGTEDRGVAVVDTMREVIFPGFRGSPAL